MQSSVLDSRQESTGLARLESMCATSVLQRCFAGANVSSRDAVGLLCFEAADAVGEAGPSCPLIKVKG